MRVTKKMLKEAKSGLSRRIKELVPMADDELKVEVDRCFPYRDKTVESKHADLLEFILQDLVELCIPSHWVD